MPSKKASAIPFRTILKELPSGDVVSETSGDGTWLRFECDCLDALLYCRAACCGLPGIAVERDELDATPLLVDFVVPDGDGGWEMIRESDGNCCCLDRNSRQCRIYKDRPRTCQHFHCTRALNAKGFRLDFEWHTR